MMLYSKKKIKKALKETTIQWANIYSGHEYNKNCPLCDMFLFLNDCNLCPIMAKTGLPNCEGTPYNEFVDHQKNEHGIDVSNGMVTKCTGCTKIARRQFVFVSNLLKEKRSEK